MNSPDEPISASWVLLMSGVLVEHVSGIRVLIPPHTNVLNKVSVCHTYRHLSQPVQG